MKIIFPALFCENLGTSLLAALATRDGHEVSLTFSSGLLDDKFYFHLPRLASFFDDRQAVIQSIEDERPDVLACSAITLNYQWMLDLATRAKERLPHLKVVFGGVHASAVPARVLAHPTVDFVCVGEGDLAFPALLRALDAGGPVAPIPNVWRKEADGTIVPGPRGRFVDDLDQLPFFDKTIWEAHVQVGELYKTMASRGCPHRCPYCFNSYFAALHDGASAYLRWRSADHLLAELKLAKRRYRLRRVEFHDDVFTANRAWLFPFLERYRREIGVPFQCCVHADAVDDEIAVRLAAAGCAWVEMGVQTVDDEYRRTVLGRRDTIERIGQSLAALKRRGIKVKVDHILGLPDERPAAQQEAWHFYQASRPDRIQAFWLSYLPGTDFMRQAVASGALSAADVDRIEDGRDVSGFHDAGGMKDIGRRRFFRAYETAFQLLPALPRSWTAKIRPEGLARLPGFLLAVIGRSAELLSSLRSGNPDLRLFGKHYVHHLTKWLRRRLGFRTPPATRATKSGDLAVAWDAGRAVMARTFGLPTAKPAVLYLDVAARCNLACAYCGVRDYGQSRQGTPELSREEWIDVIEQAGAIGVRAVSFGGGEPLVRDDMVDLIAAATRVGLRTHVNTNGVLLSAEVAARLGEAGLQAASISLDSHVPAHHEQLRGPGSFAGAVDAVRNLRRFSPRTTICLNCTVGRHNVDDMEGVLAVAHDLHADMVKFTPLDSNLAHHHKPREDFADVVLTAGDAERVDRAVQQIISASRTDPLVGNSTPFLRGMARRLREPVHTRCLAGYLFCTIDPWGEVFPCYEIRSGLNIRRQGLAALWRSAEFDALRKEVRRCARRCWDVGSTEPSLLLDPFVIRGKLHALTRAYGLIGRRG